MAAIFDIADIAIQVAMSLRLAGSPQRIRSSRVAIAVGIEPTMMLAVGSLADLLRANSASLRSSDAPVRVEADEAVSLDALDTDADAVAATMARLLAARVSAHN